MTCLSQQVMSRSKIHNHSPACLTARDALLLQSITGHTIETQRQIVKTTAIIDGQEKVAAGTRQLAGLESSRRDRDSLCFKLLRGRQCLIQTSRSRRRLQSGCCTAVPDIARVKPGMSLCRYSSQNKQ